MMHAVSNLNRRAKPLPYSYDALRLDLIRVRDAWLESRRRHDRFSIYGYLTAVFDLVMVWRMEGQEIERAHRSLEMYGVRGVEVSEPFAAVIASTSPPKHVDAKARSKYARVLMFAAEYKSHREPLAAFIGRHGGINLAATEFTRLGRHHQSKR